MVYDGGPALGQLGSAVILGHVDSTLGPGKLFNFKLLEAGDLIHVTVAGGVVTTFVVNRVAEYAKSHFLICWCTDHTALSPCSS